MAGTETRPMEVSGQGGMSLLQAIRDGVVDTPPLVSWNTWQQWRRDEGLRPTAQADGPEAVPNNRQEALLWRQTMESEYGVDWQTDLAVQESEALENEQFRAEQVAQEAQSREPRSVEPAADALRPGSVSPDPLRSPGSGSVTGALSPGSGQASVADSWRSSAPGTPKTLKIKVLVAYEPSKMPLEQYLERLAKQARALEVIGEPLESGVLELMVAKAGYQLRLHEEAKNEPRASRKLLKQEYVVELLSIDGTAGQTARLTALEALLEEAGESCEVLKSAIAVGMSVTSSPAPTPTRASTSRPRTAPSSPQPREPRFLRTGRWRGNPSTL